MKFLNIKFFGGWFLALLPFLLSQCGDLKNTALDDANGSNSVQISGTISVELAITGAALNATDANGQLVGQTITDENGNYVLNLSPDYDGPVYLEAQSAEATLSNVVLAGEISAGATTAAGQLGAGAQGRFTRNLNPLTTHVVKSTLGENPVSALATTNKEVFDTQANEVVTSALGGGMDYARFSENASAVAPGNTLDLPASPDLLIVKTIAKRARKKGSNFGELVSNRDTLPSCQATAGNSGVTPPPFLESDAFQAELANGMISTGYSAEEAATSLTDFGLSGQIIETLNKLTTVIESFTANLPANIPLTALRNALDGLTRTVLAIIDNSQCGTTTVADLSDDAVVNIISNTNAIAGSAFVDASQNNSAGAENQEGLMDFLADQAATTITASGSDMTDSELDTTSLTTSVTGETQSATESY